MLQEDNNRKGLTDMKRFTVLLDDETYSELRKYADENDRPLAVQARRYIKRCLFGESVQPEIYLPDEEMGERLLGDQWPNLKAKMDHMGYTAEEALEALYEELKSKPVEREFGDE